MLETLLWNNMLLSEEMKSQLVEYYSCCPVTTVPLKKPLSTVGNFLHTKWFRSQCSLAEEGSMPRIFWLLGLGGKSYDKVSKLIEWGLNPHIYYEHQGMKYNLVVHVISLYGKGELPLEGTIGLLSKLLVKNVVLFPQEMNLNTLEKSLGNMADTKYSTLCENLASWIDRPLFQFLINCSYVSLKDKCVLDYIKLKDTMGAYYSEKHTVGQRPNHSYDKLYSVVGQIEKIISRGYLFYNQSSRYNTLRHIFSLDEFAEDIKNLVVLKCYEQFSDLGEVAKKTLTIQLVNKRKELVLFNLLSYGLDINWSINGNMVGLEMLTSLPLIKAVLKSDHFNIYLTDGNGNNIFHILTNNPNLLRGHPINDVEIKELLSRHLSNKNKDWLFFQYNLAQQTPLMQALSKQDAVMIEYLLSWNIQPWHVLEGMEGRVSCALNYLEEVLLADLYQQVTSHLFSANKPGITTVDLEEVETFWLGYKKQWHSEQNYQKLSGSLPRKKLIGKVNKI